MIPRYCKPCGENLLPEQQECPFCGQTSVPLDEIISVVASWHHDDCEWHHEQVAAECTCSTYRGWTIEPYRKPDGCFYAYAPDYDGAVPWHTTCGKTRKAVRAEIDCIIEERSA